MTTPRSVGGVARRAPVIAALTALVAVAVLAAVLVGRQLAPFGFEVAWMDAMVAHRSPAWTGVALALNALGGSLLAIAVLPSVAAVALLVVRRPWAAAYVLLAPAVGAVLVQIAKNLVGRPRPPDMLVSPDVGSFPSGHSANTALLATVLGVVVARAWVWAAGAVVTVAMMLSRTYLAAHWITDTVAGLLVGAATAVLLGAVVARRLDDEQRSAPDLVRRGRR